MNSNSKKIRIMALTGFFIALQIVMTVTQIGYIPIGPINVTTMHIPVILAGIFLGPNYGAAVGFVFGLTSMLRATFWTSSCASGEERALTTTTSLSLMLSTKSLCLSGNRR